MRLNLHAGHTRQLGKSPGANGSSVGGFKESVKNRMVVYHMKKELRKKGHTVYDCTCEGYSAKNNLYRIVKKCNEHTVYLDVSIHFDCYNGKAHGTGTEIYSSGSKAKKYASVITKKLHKQFGFTDRGVNIRPDLYYLKHTANPAVLIEVCFCDSKEDYRLFKKGGGSKMVAKCIVDAILEARRK